MMVIEHTVSRANTFFHGKSGGGEEKKKRRRKRIVQNTEIGRKMKCNKNDASTLFLFFVSSSLVFEKKSLVSRGNTSMYEAREEIKKKL